MHVLCCDCDECLNGSGGLVLPGCGVVTKFGERGAVVREFERARLRVHEARQRAKARAKKGAAA